MLKKRPKTLGGLAGKLLVVEPEYPYAVYKKLTSKRRGKAGRRRKDIVADDETGFDGWRVGVDKCGNRRV